MLFQRVVCRQYVFNMIMEPAHNKTNCTKLHWMYTVIFRFLKTKWFGWQIIWVVFYVTACMVKCILHIDMLVKNVLSEGRNEFYFPV